jgi:hypothetical protein
MLKNNHNLSNEVITEEIKEQKNNSLGVTVGKQAINVGVKGSSEKTTKKFSKTK